MPSFDELLQYQEQPDDMFKRLISTKLPPPKVFGRKSIDTTKGRYSQDELDYIKQTGTLDKTPPMDPGRELGRLGLDVAEMGYAAPARTIAAGYSGAAVLFDQMMQGKSFDEALQASTESIQETRAKTMPGYDQPSLPMKKLEENILRPVIEGGEELTGNTGLVGAAADFAMNVLPLKGIKPMVRGAEALNTMMGQRGSIEVSNPFYSAAEKAVADPKFGGAMKAQSVEPYLRKMGVTTDELKMLKIPELVKEKGVTGMFNMLQDAIKNEGGGAKGVAKVAAKYGIPATALAAWLRADDETRKKMMTLTPGILGIIRPESKIKLGDLGLKPIIREEGTHIYSTLVNDNGKVLRFDYDNSPIGYEFRKEGRNEVTVRSTQLPTEIQGSKVALSLLSEAIDKFTSEGKTVYSDKSRTGATEHFWKDLLPGMGYNVQHNSKTNQYYIRPSSQKLLK